MAGRNFCYVTVWKGSRQTVTLRYTGGRGIKILSKSALRNVTVERFLSNTKVDNSKDPDGVVPM